MHRRLVDHDSDRAVHRQLADILRERIQSGDLEPGARLPGEIDLCQEHGVARSTVRLAVAILRAEGLVITIPHRGSRVREQGEREMLELKTGDVVWPRMPTAEERKRLKVPEGVPLLVVKRADGSEELHPGDSIKAGPLDA